MTKSVEIDINSSPYLQNAIAKLSESAAQTIRSTSKPGQNKSA